MKSYFRSPLATSAFLFQNNKENNKETADSSWIESAKKKLSDLSKEVTDFFQKEQNKATEVTNDTWDKATQLTDKSWKKLESVYIKIEKISEETWASIKEFYNQSVVPFFEGKIQDSKDVLKNLEDFFARNGKKISENSKKDFESFLKETNKLMGDLQIAISDMHNWAEKAKNDTSKATQNDYNKSVESVNKLRGEIEEKEEKLVEKIILFFSKSEEKK